MNFFQRLKEGLSKTRGNFTAKVDELVEHTQAIDVEFYDELTDILILSDAGGSNGSRSRLWKIGVQRLANTTGLRIYVSHFPPGTSKWNKIEHRMFAFITQNWRGRPLVSYETIINLIGSTTTSSGLRIKAKLNRKKYETGLRVSNADLAKVNLKPAKFHGDWNYSILPKLT